jgi:L-methionine (R)-S-oxide reductase
MRVMVERGTFTGNREQDYPLAIRQARLLWEADLPLVSNLANVSALLKQCLPRTNWVGFYLWDRARAQLVLGPFQGLPACTHIGFGKGVCGTSIKERRTQRVPDVHDFPGHIACDSASVSEIVVPILRGEVALGVLDADSPERARFDAVDQHFLEEVASVLMSLWPRS